MATKKEIMAIIGEASDDAQVFFDITSMNIRVVEPEPVNTAEPVVEAEVVPEAPVEEVKAE